MTPFIVDSQIHIWGPDVPERPWPAGMAWRAQRPEPLMKEEILSTIDAAGVSRAVLVPTRWDGDKNDLAIEAVRSHPDRFAIMGRIAVEKPESRGIIANWKSQPGMLGIRLIFNDSETLPWLADGTADWIWPACEAAGLPIMVIAPFRLPLIGAVAARHPGLRLIVDHMGLVLGAKDAAATEHIPDLLALAGFPNVGVKASALPCYTSDPYPFANMQAAFRRVFDAFGPHRVFWGSDLSRLRVPYRQMVTMFTEEMPWLGEADRDWVMGRALCHWIDWPLPPGA